MENLISQFDYLTPEDGAALNAMQSAVVFEIEDPAPQEPRTFTLEAYAADIEDLSGPGLDEYCEACSRPNPKRKVRRDNQ